MYRLVLLRFNQLSWEFFVVSVADGYIAQPCRLVTTAVLCMAPALAVAVTVAKSFPLKGKVE
jgi:hypothetical protein